MQNIPRNMKVNLVERLLIVSSKTFNQGPRCFTVTDVGFEQEYLEPSLNLFRRSTMEFFFAKKPLIIFAIHKKASS